MYIDIHTKMTKYLLRLKNIAKERLVCKTYQEQLDETENRNHWLWKMKEILDKDGDSYIFLDMTENESEITEGDIRSLSNKIKCKGKEIFEQKIFHHIQNKSEKGEGKLLFYAKLKQQFKQEKYLNLTNIKHRNALRDIRMSIHKGTLRYRKNIG